MTAFHHEGSRGDQPSHLRVVEGVPEVELEDLVLDRERVGVAVVARTCRSRLSYPLVEVCRAYRQAILLHKGGHSHGRLPAVGQAVEGDPVGIDERQARKPADDLSMLGHDQGEQRSPQGVRLALERAELVQHQVWILRGEHDVALLAQLGREVVVGPMVSLDHVPRATLQPVLADHHRSALALLHSLRDQQDSESEQVGVYVQRHLVARPEGLVEYLAGTRRKRQEVILEEPDHLFLETFPVRGRALGEGVEGRELHLEGGAADEVRFVQRPLDETVDLAEATLVASLRVGQGSDLFRCLALCRNKFLSRKGLHKGFSRSAFSRRALAILPARENTNAVTFPRQLLGSLDLPPNLLQAVRGETARSRPRRVNRHLWTPACLHQYLSRHHHGCQFRVTKQVQEAKDVSFQRLLPHSFPCPEMARYPSRLYPLVQGRRPQSQHSTLAPACDPDRLFSLLRKPVHRRQRLLDLVALQGTSHQESRPMQQLPVAHLHSLAPGMVGLHGPVHQCGNHHSAARFRQSPRKLSRRRRSFLKAREGFGSLVGIGQGDDLGGRLPPHGFKQQALPEGPLQRRPTNGEHLVSRSLGHPCRPLGRAHQRRCLEGRSRILRTEYSPQFLPRLFLELRTILSRLPSLRSFPFRFLQLAVQVAMGPVQHPLGQVSLEGQGLGSRQELPVFLCGKG